MIGYMLRMLTGASATQKKLKQHFGGRPLEGIVTAARTFPVASRVDVQLAVDHFFRGRGTPALLGIHSPLGHETPTLAHLFTRGPFPVEIGPLQHDDVDIGDPAPVRCLKNGLWLSKERDLPFALLLGPAMKHGIAGGVHVELAVPQGEAGLHFSQDFFRELEARVNIGGTYRGRVISLESDYAYSGSAGAVKIHRLHAVCREEVILPDKTLTLLDRNVGSFIAARQHIKSLGLSAKKGLLFYGPPGTGKTHTIHYLASQLPGHTTLLIIAEQVRLLDEYFRLARFLQPSLVVVEDIDLIAREREQTDSVIKEVLLNKLLNEMDGLREDADVIFVLTTNRPDLIEPALASRPGRIDQAIEFPLPDEQGRSKLIRLYARGLELPERLLELMVRRTKGASPAFIKELMRRAAQFQFEAGAHGNLQQAAFDSAIEEMVFSGGALNLKLLGGSSGDLGSANESAFRQ
ncbi:MAG: cell division protein FtsH [Acidobacteria bacterium]|nr:MAG: cell division protein FtsH [Acidobacteriota bacterium]